MQKSISGQSCQAPGQGEARWSMHTLHQSQSTDE